MRRPPRNGGDMITTTSQKIATLLAVLVVLAAAGGIAQAATSKPSSMSQAEYRALTLRSEALNKQYGLGKWSAAAQIHVPTRGFAWGAFGIGAVAMLGLVLVAGGVVAGSRHSRETPRVRTS